MRLHFVENFRDQNFNSKKERWERDVGNVETNVETEVWKKCDSEAAPLGAWVIKCGGLENRLPLPGLCNVADIVRAGLGSAASTGKRDEILGWVRI